MTRDQLETLEAIIETGSFKAAAVRLHKTQPALSVAVKKLEDEFQLRLFDRSEYRPRLTEAGRIFYDQAKESLAAFRRLEKFGRELGLNKAEPRITIVMDPLARFEILESVFAGCLGPESVTELILLSEVMGGGVERLLGGEADFAIGPLLTADKRIDSLPLGRQEMIPVAARSLLRKAKPDLDWLKENTQVVVVQTENGGRVLRRDQAGLLAGGKKCFVTDHSLKKKLILEGLGWGRLAENEIETELKEGSLVRIRDKEATVFQLDFHVMRSNQHPLGPVGQRLWRAFRG